LNKIASAPVWEIFTPAMVTVLKLSPTTPLRTASVIVVFVISPVLCLPK